MKKIIEFLSSHGMMVMLSGFFVSVCGVLIYALAKTKTWDISVQHLSFAITIIGLCVYIVGRVFVAMERKNKSKNTPPPVSPKEDDL